MKVRLVRHGLLARHGLLLVLPCALTVIACGGDDAAPDLDGTSWTLTGWSVSSLDPADFTITASFADGTISGTSAVNSYSGPYEVGPDDEFSTGDIASTMMAGPADAMRAEQLYFELLGAAASYQVVGGTLTLFDEFGDEALVFATTGE
jgi:heat shock protein HslJ